MRLIVSLCDFYQYISNATRKSDQRIFTAIYFLINAFLLLTIKYQRNSHFFYNAFHPPPPPQ
jgi:hypothetical protein